MTSKQDPTQLLRKWIGLHYPSLTKDQIDRCKVYPSSDISVKETTETIGTNLKVPNSLRIQLDEENCLVVLPPFAELEAFQLSYSTLKTLRPEEKQTIKLYGKEMVVPRRFLPYLSSYTFSRKTHKQVPTPDFIRPFLLFMCQLVANYAGVQVPQEESDLTWDTSKENPFQVLMNHYLADLKEVIHKHSDDEKQLLKSAIGSCTFNSTKTGGRLFRISKKPETKPKETKQKDAKAKTNKSDDVTESKDHSSESSTKSKRAKPGSNLLLDIVLPDGCFVIMLGQTFQTHYLHEIPFMKLDKGIDRINFTVRVLLDESQTKHTGKRTSSSPYVSLEEPDRTRRYPSSSSSSK